MKLLILRFDYLCWLFANFLGQAVFSPFRGLRSPFQCGSVPETRSRVLRSPTSVQISFLTLGKRVSVGNPRQESVTLTLTSIIHTYRCATADDRQKLNQSPIGVGHHRKVSSDWLVVFGDYLTSDLSAPFSTQTTCHISSLWEFS